MRDGGADLTGIAAMNETPGRANFGHNRIWRYSAGRLGALPDAGRSEACFLCIGLLVRMGWN